MVCLQTNSSQVASADVLGRRILVLRKRTNPVLSSRYPRIVAASAIDQNQTDGNTTYLANLQTRKTLGEIRGTDYFENQNHRDLQVVWALLW
jgi:hypothetical protein